ncbi:MAG: metallophosphoesterase [Thermoproteota archaeon]
MTILREVRLVHVADSHLDPRLAFLGPKVYERRRDFMKSFMRVIEYVIETKPHVFIIAGDLFDSINPRNPVRTSVLQAIRRINSEGVKVFSVAGNHDSPRSQEEGMSPLNELEASGHMVFFSSPRDFQVDHLQVGDLDVAVTGISFDHSLSPNVDPLQHYNLKMPAEGDVNIAVMHYNFAGFRIPKYWEAPTILSKSLPEELDYLALGHIHSSGSMRVGRTLIAYSGSTERRSFNEEEDAKKGFLDVTIRHDGESEARFIEVPARPLKTFEVVLDESVEKPVEHVLSLTVENRSETFARLIIRGVLPLDRIRDYSKAELLKRLENRFFYTLVDDSELKCLFREVKLSTSFTGPVEAYRRTVEAHVEKAGEEEKRVLDKALSLGLAVLEEVGAW